jgi:hypothetical protein
MTEIKNNIGARHTTNYFLSRIPDSSSDKRRLLQIKDELDRLERRE